MNRPTLAAPSPPLADLSLNWVIRRASPKPVRHCSTQPSWAWAGIWLCTKIAERAGSMPMASSWAAARRRALAQHLRVLLDGDRVQVGDEEERLVVALEVDPLPQGAEVVAEVEGVGGRLDAGQHPGPGAAGDHGGYGDLGLGRAGHRRHASTSWQDRGRHYRLPQVGSLARLPPMSRSPPPSPTATSTLRAHRPDDDAGCWSSSARPGLPALDHRAGALRHRGRPHASSARSCRAGGPTTPSGASRSRTRAGTPAPISLRNEGSGRAEIAYGSHPAARGTGPWSGPCGCCSTGASSERDLQTVIWWAHEGNWASRKLAWRLGFSFEGTVRRWLAQRGELHDAWVGTLLRDDPRSPRTRVARHDRSSTPTGCGCGPLQRPRRAPHRRGLLGRPGPSTGWVSCPRPTREADARA